MEDTSTPGGDLAKALEAGDATAVSTPSNTQTASNESRSSHKRKKRLSALTDELGQQLRSMQAPKVPSSDDAAARQPGSSKDRSQAARAGKVSRDRVATPGSGGARRPGSGARGGPYSAFGFNKKPSPRVAKTRTSGGSAPAASPEGEDSADPPNAPKRRRLATAQAEVTGESKANIIYILILVITGMSVLQATRVCLFSAPSLGSCTSPISSLPHSSMASLSVPESDVALSGFPFLLGVFSARHSALHRSVRSSSQLPSFSPATSHVLVYYPHPSPTDVIETLVSL